MKPAYESLEFGIGELPNELLLEIVTHLGPIRGFLASQTDESARQEENAKRVKSLYSLTLTCQKLNGLCESILYQSFIQHPSDSWSPRLFLEAITKKPSLAKHLQYVESLPDIKNKKDKLEGPFQNDDIEKMFYLLNGERWDPRFLKGRVYIGGENAKEGEDTFDLHNLYHVSMRKEWLGRRRSQVAVAVIIALAENLVDVAILDPQQSILGVLALKRYAEPKGLRHLWIQALPEVDLQNWLVVSGFPTTSIPVSESLWVANFHQVNVPDKWLDGSWDHRPIRYSMTDTAEVILDGCEIGPSVLDRALQTINALKRFTCRWGSPELGSFLLKNGPAPIDLPRLLHSLSKHKRTLEYLVLDTLESGWMVSLDQSIPPIGSLRDFTSLKRLDVSGLVLWEDNDINITDLSLAAILPESLEELTIRTEWDEDVEDYLFCLPQDCTSMLPNLKSVDCSWRPAPEHSASLLISAFEDVGVDLRLQTIEGF